MTRTLLVLGGSGFVGHAVVQEGLARGWEVATFSRGHAPSSDPPIRRIIGERLDRSTLQPLRSRDWDLVVDTWSGAPRAVLDSTTVLADHAARYAYISTVSVYASPLPLGVQETAATVIAGPDSEAGDYPELKRGAELALLSSFGDRGLVARPGLILGPREDVGRLTWWLTRMAAGGEILAPGPSDLPIQFIDARDLAAFVLDASLANRSGPYNVVCRRGHATLGSLLESCRAVAGRGDAHLTWVDPAAIAAAGVEPWTELPIWLPPDSPSIGMHAINVEPAYAAGLHCRPIPETVQDTWQWLSALHGPPPLRPDRDPPGLDAAREHAVLEAWHAAGAGDARHADLHVADES